jgi:hypothetical protein
MTVNAIVREVARETERQATIGIGAGHGAATLLSISIKPRRVPDLAVFSHIV